MIYSILSYPLHILPQICPGRNLSFPYNTAARRKRRLKEGDNVDEVPDQVDGIEDVEIAIEDSPAPETSRRRSRVKSESEHSIHSVPPTPTKRRSMTPESVIARSSRENIPLALRSSKDNLASKGSKENLARRAIIMSSRENLRNQRAASASQEQLEPLHAISPPRSESREKIYKAKPKARDRKLIGSKDDLNQAGRYGSRENLSGGRTASQTSLQNISGVPLSPTSPGATVI